MSKALSSLFSPRLLESNGDEPIPTRKANDVIMVTIGDTTPTPARHISPIPSIFPIYFVNNSPISEMSKA